MVNIRVIMAVFLSLSASFALVLLYNLIIPGVLLKMLKRTKKMARKIIQTTSVYS